MFKCPCCGNDMYEAPKLDQLLHMKLSRVQREILDKLISISPAGATMDQLLLLIYQQRDEPEHSSVGIKVQINRLRKKLKGTGWTIPNDSPGRGNAKKYRLKPEQVK